MSLVDVNTPDVSHDMVTNPTNYVLMDVRSDIVADTSKSLVLMNLTRGLDYNIISV